MICAQTRMTSTLQSSSAVMPGCECCCLQGIVVTSSVTDASPASFSSHSLYRNCHLAISAQQSQTRIADVLFGGGREYYTEQNLQADLKDAGFSYCETSECLQGVQKLPSVGLFAQKHMSWEIDRASTNEPSLSEMAMKVPPPELDW